MTTKISPKFAQFISSVGILGSLSVTACDEDSLDGATGFDDETLFEDLLESAPPQDGSSGSNVEESPAEDKQTSIELGGDRTDGYEDAIGGLFLGDRTEAMTIAELADELATQRPVDQVSYAGPASTLGEISKSMLSKAAYDFTLFPVLSEIIPRSSEVVDLSEKSLQAIANIVGHELDAHWFGRDRQAASTLIHDARYYNRLEGDLMDDSLAEAKDYRSKALDLAGFLKSYGMQGAEAYVLLASLHVTMQREVYHLVGAVGQPEHVVTQEYGNFLDAADTHIEAMESFDTQALQWSNARFGDVYLEEWVSSQSCGRVTCTTVKSYKACFDSPSGTVCTDSSSCTYRATGITCPGYSRTERKQQAEQARTSLMESTYENSRDALLGVDYDEAYDKFTNLRDWIVVNCDGSARCTAAPREIISSRSNVDAHVKAKYPNSNYGNAARLLVDTSSYKISYLRSPRIAEIPSTAEILSAELEIYISDQGDDVVIRRVLEPWSESTVTFNNRPLVANREYARFDGQGDHLFRSIDIKDLVQEWVDGTNPNYGLSFSPTGSNGVDLRSTEAEWGGAPTLRIVYVDP